MENYDDIRPYTDSEIPAAMHRIVRNDFFPLLARYVFPHLPTEQVRDMMLSFSTIYDFQYQVMRIANERIIANSIATFTCDGTSHIEPRGSYLFVSNHRDIMLDASLLQNVLLAHGHDTSEITFGANLMQGELMIDLGKSNKMFRVERGGNMKDFYLSSMHLSNYIRNAVTRLHHSVWIAQRNGRTKDGNDTTDQGIIKMFCMSHPQDKIEALEQLHIVPVTVSYEWEPCDVLKAIELYMSRTEKYIKKPGEDLTSIITGIVQPKGQVHFSIGRPLGHDELMQHHSCLPAHAQQLHCPRPALRPKPLQAPLHCPARGRLHCPPAAAAPLRLRRRARGAAQHPPGHLCQPRDQPRAPRRQRQVKA